MGCTLGTIGALWVKEITLQHCQLSITLSYTRAKTEAKTLLYKCITG